MSNLLLPLCAEIIDVFLRRYFYSGFVRYALLASVLAGCGGQDNVSLNSSTPSNNPSYTLGGTVRGLGAGLSVQLSSTLGGTITVRYPTSEFTLPNAVAVGSSYEVIVSAPPSGYTCTVTNGSGIMVAESINSVVVNCTAGSTVNTLALSSSSARHRLQIPLQHVCRALGGDNISPPLSWRDPPNGVAKYALLMDDETTPCSTGDGACRHWAIFNIPAATTNLAEGITDSALAAIDSGITQGVNALNSVGYYGPCPQLDTEQHTYNITLYALSASAPTVSNASSYTRSSFKSAMSNHILGENTLTVYFTKP